MIPAGAIAVAQPATEENGNPAASVSITLTEDGFSPAVLVVQRGQDVVWSIRNETARAGELWVPDYFARLALSVGGNDFYLTPADDFAFSDAGGRFFGYVKVVDDLESVDLDAIRSEVGQYQTLRYPASYFTDGAGGSCCQ